MTSRIFIIGLISLIIFSCKNQNKENQISNEQKEISPIDSLSNQEIPKGKLSAETLWKFGRLSDSQLSPDGKTIAYCVTYYDIKKNKGYTDIYTISSDGGDAKKITNFAGHENNIQWSNDSKKIYFLASESGSNQIWSINIDGTDATQISFIDGDINSFKLAPSNDKLFYTKDVKVEKTVSEIYPDLPMANVKITNDLMYRHWNNWTDENYSHIFISDIKNNKIENGIDIMPNERWDSPLSPYFDNEEISWSNNGKLLAYTSKKLHGKDYAVSTNSDIYIYNTENNSTINITEGMNGYDKYPVFSNNDKFIAWQSMETPGYESDKERLFIYNIETKEKTYLTDLYDQNAAHYVWNENDTEIYFITGINATYQISKINIDNKQITQLTKGKHNYNTIQKAGNVIVGEKMSMEFANEIFRIEESNNEIASEKQLTFTNKNIYDNVKMGKSEERWIKTTDGKEMLVWIIYPPDFDPTKKYPALLYCQGGPQSAVSQFFSFRWNFQMMVANDYIVIAPNRRGLPTFGTEWNKQISGDYGGQNMKDYLSAVDEMKKESFIDENKLGAIGASYGGFSVYWLAGNHNKRFKAFIAHNGMFNLESQYAATEEMFFVNHDLGGPYWEKNNQIAQKSYATSPHKFVQNWDAPIMIITGEYDFRIPYTEGMQAFNSAKLLGLEAKLLHFPNETHFVTKPQNAILWQREFFAWLDKYLKNK